MINLLQRLAELDAANPRVKKTMTQETSLATVGNFGGQQGVAEDQLDELSYNTANNAAKAAYVKAEKLKKLAQQNDPLKDPNDDPYYNAAWAQGNKFGKYAGMAKKREAGAELDNQRQAAGVSPAMMRKIKQGQQGVGEATDNSELRDAVLSVLQNILQGAQDGHDMIDDVADELGDYFDDVKNSDDETLKKAYAFAREHGAEAEDNPEAMARAMKMAISQLQTGQTDDDIEYARQWRDAIDLAKKQEADRRARDGNDARYYADGTLVTPDEVARRAAERKSKKKGMEEGLNECGPMGMMGQPHSPASINMTAASGDELSSMLKDILSLAGLQKVEPEHLGHEMPPVTVSPVPTISVGPMSAEPMTAEPIETDSESMRSVLDKLHPEEETDESYDKMYDTSPADPRDAPAFDSEEFAHHENQPGSGDDEEGEKRQTNLPTATYENLMAEYRKFINE